jgi:hypothetical protein
LVDERDTTEVVITVFRFITRLKLDVYFAGDVTLGIESGE